jgi:hypothetical protein
MIATIPGRCLTARQPRTQKAGVCSAADTSAAAHDHSVTHVFPMLGQRATTEQGPLAAEQPRPAGPRWQLIYVVII